MPASVGPRRFAYRVAARGLAFAWTAFGVRRDGVKCVIVDGDRLLLVRHTYGVRAWDLPGGAGRRGESPAATADREMGEELGLPPVGWRDLGTLRSTRGSHRVALVGAEVPDPVLRVDPVELEVVAWFPRDRLPLWLSPLCASGLGAGAVSAFLAADRDDGASSTGAVTA